MPSNTDGVETHLHIAVLAVYLGVLYRIPQRLQDQMVVAVQHSEVRLVTPMERMVAVAARMGRSEVPRCILSYIDLDGSDEDVSGGTAA